MNTQGIILVTEKNNGYELLDSGLGENGGEKLERFGDFVLRRPDPEVLWNKTKPETEWTKADAIFGHGLFGGSGKWKKTEKMEDTWNVEIGGLHFVLRTTGFKHIGVFPEQASHWAWMENKITNSKLQFANRKPKALNLFGYTGGATIALAKAGAEVTHVDALESNLTWTKENLQLNNLSHAPVRLIADDVRKFVEREIKRGNKYDAILLDPPVYGKGSKGQAWHIETDFLPLLARLRELLSHTPLFVLVSGYASEYSPISYENALTDIFVDTASVHTDSGELTIKESGTSRLLPAGIFAKAVF